MCCDDRSKAAHSNGILIADLWLNDSPDGSKPARRRVEAADDQKEDADG
jgi:hypothetical protein